jgi:hypothetical protein
VTSTALTALARAAAPAYGDSVIDHDPAPAWAADAADALRDLGFTLLNSDRPAAPGGSQLLVALRDRPTLRHFDPELVTCWVAVGGRGRALTIDRTVQPGERQILWGHVHVIDRLAVENRFLTFGGQLRIRDVNRTLRVVEHVSAGPVVRWGGHSQGFDDLAGEIGAFFGRLILPVDFAAGGEARLSTEPPENLYAAFLRDTAARRREAAQRRRSLHDDLERDDPVGRWLSAEIARIRERHRTWWEAAGRLLDDLDLGPEGMTSERAAEALAARERAAR